MVSDSFHPDNSTTIRQLADEVFEQALVHLKNLVAIPSLSVPSAESGPVNQSAQYVLDMFSGVVDWDHLAIHSTGLGRPAVIARKNPADGHKTVLLYAHHDVQPAGPVDQWESDPFVADIRDGRLYGRGSADDGAGIVAHWQALTLLARVAPDFGGLGVVLFIEGEEESGSPTFPLLLQEHHDLLRADVIVVADSDNPSVDSPAVTTSLRGVVGMTVTLATGSFPVHSGMFGGVVPDAPTALVRLLATLHDDSGNPMVHFDLPESRSQQELSEEALRDEAGLLPGVSLLGEGSLSDRLWWSTAITVTGFAAPRPDEASNTLWPTASARISMRVPPGVDPELAGTALESHLRENTPWGASLTVSDVEQGPGFVGVTDHPVIDLFAECAQEVFGHPLVLQGVGGAIPFISLLAESFKDAVVVVTGVEDPHSRAHGTNESVDIGMLARAGLTEALFVSRLSQPD